MVEHLKVQLGNILVNKNIITKDSLDEAILVAKDKDLEFDEFLVTFGYATEQQVVDAKVVLYDTPSIDLKGIRIESNILNMIPSNILRKDKILPICLDETTPNTLIVAMSDPMNMVAQDDISIITGYNIEPRIGAVTEINKALDRYFGVDEILSAAKKYSQEREEQIGTVEEFEEDKLDIENAPIVRIVRSVIEQAVRQRASDIHFDVLENKIRVRYRIDGVLNDKMMYDISLLPAIVTRIKIMGNMDISEKRRPQDGRITIIIDHTEYDIRVSVLPSTHGEKIVMRLAAKNAFTMSKSDLGMRDKELQLFEYIISNPNGILLVTGPTGSGKSTTLYTALSELNKEEVNIITVEDPVEANIEGINQVQVNPKANLTFTTAFRAILRQDPDIIMIGEMRDYETAAIAVQASITGHLVMSTLHTNSASSAFTRLLDMGVEPYLLADSVVGVIAQRLMRKLCNHCKKPRQATLDEKKLLGKQPTDDVIIYDAVGCRMCNDIGFHGRIGVYEIIKMSPELKQIISARGTTEEIKSTAINQGMRTLRMGAVDYVLDGTSTVEEMLKVSFEN